MAVVHLLDILALFCTVRGSGVISSIFLIKSVNGLFNLYLLPFFSKLAPERMN